MSGNYVEFDYVFPNSKKTERIGRVMFNSPTAYNQTMKFINEIRKVTGKEPLQVLPVYITNSNKITTPIEAFTGCEVDGNYLILKADNVNRSYVKRKGHLCNYWRTRYVVFVPKKLGNGIYEQWFNVDSGMYAIPIPTRVRQVCNAVREAISMYGSKKVAVIVTESGVEVIKTNKIIDLNIMYGDKNVPSKRLFRERANTPMIRRKTFSGSYMQKI